MFLVIIISAKKKKAVDRMPAIRLRFLISLGDKLKALSKNIKCTYDNIVHSFYVSIFRLFQGLGA